MYYYRDMETTISALRAHIKEAIATAKDGEDVVITERGVPVARISAAGVAPFLERLTSQGAISAPGVTRPRLTKAYRVSAKQPVSELVGQQRT
jgi:prevent-host-death family protein